VYPPTRKQINSYCNLGTYTWQEFLALLIEMFVYIPCLLCGEIHELRIHALLWRKIRSPEEVSNTDIIIIAIICLSAKKLGKQYTKRLLPPFVIPYCVIDREAVLAYLHHSPAAGQGEHPADPEDPGACLHRHDPALHEGGDHRSEG
jgi:hypothetical protein